MGLFGMAEVLLVAERAGGLPQIKSVGLRELFPTREEWRCAWPAILRGTGLGFLVGLIPGPSATLSTFASYRLERRLAKESDGFGAAPSRGWPGQSRPTTPPRA